MAFLSKRLKEIVQEHLTGKEGINWLTAKVNGKGQQNTYYILRFGKMLDVLDFEKTTFVRDTDLVINPCFSLSKINDIALFPVPSSHSLWKISSNMYINERLKKAIQKQKMKGVDFERGKVV